MIKRKLLQLAACGILILSSVSCSWYDSHSSYTEDSYFSMDDEDLADGCGDYIYISGYYFDEDADPDMRYAIPSIRLRQFAIENLSDSVAASIAQCILAVMDAMEIDHVYFMGKLVSYDEIVEMSEF